MEVAASGVPNDETKPEVDVTFRLKVSAAMLLDAVLELK